MPIWLAPAPQLTVTLGGSPLTVDTRPVGAVGGAHEIARSFAAPTTEASGANDPFCVPSAQRTPDCQPRRSASSRRRKLKIEATYGWQYASLTAYRSCVAWSGAGLVASGEGFG